MREQFDKLVAEKKIQKHHVDKLIALVTTGYCYHKSWGCGKIRTLDPVFARFTIDFPGKPGHVMALSFAAETLQPLQKDHILVRKLTELETLKKLAQENPVELVKLAITSCGGKATVAQLQQLLTPDIVETDWKKWWDNVKPLLRKSGLFQLPLKKSDPIVLLDRQTSLTERLLDEFNRARGLKERIQVAIEILESSHELPDLQLVAQEITETIDKEISAYAASQPAVALEAIFVRDDLIATSGIQLREGALTSTEIWNQITDIASLLEEITPTKRKRAIQSLKSARPDNWPQLLLGIINDVSAKLCHTIAEVLVESGYLDQLKEMIEKLIIEKRASSELLLWLFKDRNDLYADLLGPIVFKAALAAIDRDQFGEKRVHKLRDYIVSDQNLIADLLASADLEEVQDITRMIQLSPAFTDERDRRVLLGRIIKMYPMMQSMITSEHTKQERTILVSWESLERKRAEYLELVHKKIPANARDIAHARSYGDLRENAEYKAAKEMQKLLFERKAQLEAELASARGTDFANVSGEIVEPGTIVTFTDINSGAVETVTILGAWDNDPDRGIISYMSPLAQALLGKKVGDILDISFALTNQTIKIISIEPYNKTAYTRTPAEVNNSQTMATPIAHESHSQNASSEASDSA